MPEARLARTRENYREPGIAIRYVREYDIVPDLFPSHICQCGYQSNNGREFHNHRCREVIADARQE